MCSEWLRPRFIYSQYKLNHIEQVALSQTIESLLYTCDSTLKGVQAEVQLQPEIVNVLFERVHVHENITCKDPVEIPYYSSERPFALAVLVNVMKLLKDSTQYIGTVALTARGLQAQGM